METTYISKICYNIQQLNNKHILNRLFENDTYTYTCSYNTSFECPFDLIYDNNTKKYVLKSYKNISYDFNNNLLSYNNKYNDPLDVSFYKIDKIIKKPFHIYEVYSINHNPFISNRIDDNILSNYDNYYISNNNNIIDMSEIIINTISGNIDMDKYKISSNKKYPIFYNHCFNNSNVIHIKNINFKTNVDILKKTITTTNNNNTVLTIYIDNYNI